MLTRFKQRGITALFIYHYVKMAMIAAYRVTVLDFGRKVAQGPPGTVRIDLAGPEASLGKWSAHAQT